MTKLCKDCMFYEKNEKAPSHIANSPLMEKCKKARHAYAYDGKLVVVFDTCSNERSSFRGWSCGHSARFFEPKLA